MKKILLKRPILSWALYDWANSAFATTVMAAVFPVYYAELTGELSAEKSQFYFGLAASIPSIVIALLAPILGAIADRGGKRKKFLAFFAYSGALMTGCLVFVHAGHWPSALILYALGTVGFSGANIFYDSMLLDVTEEQHFDMVSAYGYGLGYLGGGTLLAVNAWMILSPATFGLASEQSAYLASFVSVAVWWAVFSLPILLFVHETPTERPAKGMQAIGEGWTQLLGTIKELRKFRTLLLFLIGYWLYIDGVNTVVKTATFFGTKVLGLGGGYLVLALLVTQFVAFPSALAFGWLGGRIGPKRGILLGLAVYIGALVYAWRGLTTVEGFFGLAVAVGLVQGGVQSLSRSLYARMVPADKGAEFFGFFNMVGKFASIIGPMLMGVVPLITDDARDGILAVSVLFIVGGILLSRVNVEEGQRAAVADAPKAGSD